MCPNFAFHFHSLLMITVYSYHYYDGQNQYNHSLSLWLLWWTELQCIIIFIMMDKINIILLQARVVWLHWILVTMRSTKYTVHITQYTVHTDISDFSFRLKIHVEFKVYFPIFCDGECGRVRTMYLVTSSQKIESSQGWFHDL